MVYRVLDAMRIADGLNDTDLSMTTEVPQPIKEHMMRKRMSSRQAALMPQGQQRGPMGIAAVPPRGVPGYAGGGRPSGYSLFDNGFIRYLRDLTVPGMAEYGINPEALAQARAVQAARQLGQVPGQPGAGQQPLPPIMWGRPGVPGAPAPAMGAPSGIAGVRRGCVVGRCDQGGHSV